MTARRTTATTGSTSLDASTTMLKPLQQWFCDRCGQVIERPEEGWVEWLDDDGGPHAFKIVHHATFSPRETPNRCYFYADSPDEASNHLHNLVEEGVIPWLLSCLDVVLELDREHNNPPQILNGAIRDYVELFRRLCIPYFEEARLHW